MHTIQVSDQVYDRAQRRAFEAGFASVDDYVVLMLAYDEGEDGENYDNLFTPERIAELDQIAAEVEAGGVTYTMDEVREHLAQNRADWMSKLAR